MDDALSIKHVKDDIYEIGVHIADVGHFVQENSILDQEARLRTTSIYLVQKYAIYLFFINLLETIFYNLNYFTQILYYF